MIPGNNPGNLQLHQIINTPSVHHSGRKPLEYVTAVYTEVSHKLLSN